MVAAAAAAADRSWNHVFWWCRRCVMIRISVHLLPISISIVMIDFSLLSLFFACLQHYSSAVKMASSFSGRGGTEFDAARSVPAGRPGGHLQYGGGEMAAAVAAYLRRTCGQRASYVDVAEQFAVPVSTLKEHVSKASSLRGKQQQQQRPGKPSVLAVDDEAWLVQWLDQRLRSSEPPSQQA